jgi:hypothetical protein
MKKSQSSLEFMMFIGMAIIVLMAYFGVAHFYLNKTYKERDIISGEDLIKLIKNEIDLASRVQGNYNRFIDIPSTVNYQEYTGSVTGREITINISGVEYVGLLSAYISVPYSFNSSTRIFLSKYNNEISLVNPAYHHTECQELSCATLLGEGSDGCSIDDDCSHMECISNMCTIIPEPGISDCDLEGMPCVTPGYHSECNELLQCVEVEGEGANGCQLFIDDCMHSECNEFYQCVSKPGEGNDICILGNPISCTYLECQNNMCIRIQGSGLDTCNPEGFPC